MSNRAQDVMYLNFMSLVLDMNKTFNLEYNYDWKKPGYNFYVEKYKLKRSKHKLTVEWVNPSDDLNIIIYRQPPFRSSLLNKIYFKMFSVVSTSDKKRYSNVLSTVIFSDFCNELELDVDFSDVEDADTADAVVCALYNNFFAAIPIDKFFDMFDMCKFLTEDSVRYIKAHTQYVPVDEE